MPKHFSIRLLIPDEWSSSLNDISKAHMISRLALLRRYIHKGMITDLEEIKEGIERLKRIEATKNELRQKVKAHGNLQIKSITEPIDY
jgi:hypothetical protein